MHARTDGPNLNMKVRIGTTGPPRAYMWSVITIALLCVVVNWNERQGSGPEGDEVL